MEVEDSLTLDALGITVVDIVALHTEQLFTILPSLLVVAFVVVLFSVCLVLETASVFVVPQFLQV